jgi:hypothetical protein
MGASTSQHTTSIDFGRRCVACAEARPPPASKLDAGAVTTMTTAEIAVALGDARRRAEASKLDAGAVTAMTTAEIAVALGDARRDGRCWCGLAHPRSKNYGA